LLLNAHAREGPAPRSECSTPTRAGGSRRHRVEEVMIAVLFIVLASSTVAAV